MLTDWLEWFSQWHWQQPWALLALPLPWLLRWLPPRRRRDLIAPELPLLARSGQDSAGVSRSGVLGGLAALGWLLIVLAAAQPQQQGEAVPLSREGRDLMLAVDLSGSMDTRDMQIGNRRVSRLTAVQAIADRFIEARRGDRVGLIVFGDQAYLQTPLTFDRTTVREHLRDMSIGLIGKETAIADGLALAVKQLSELSDNEERVLILLTDGRNNAGNFSLDEAISLAEQFEVTVHTIGFGATEMVVDSLFGRQRVPTGSDIDEDTLRRIADSTGGQFFRARSANELSEVYARIDEIEPVERDEAFFRPIHDRYRWPLAAGLAALLLWLSANLLARRGARREVAR